MDSEITDIFQTDFLRKLQYETPFFLFSKERIEYNFKSFRKHFPEAEVFYAMKANFEPEILKILYEAGSGFEVASKFELKNLKDLGVEPEKIIYGTAIKPIDHIKDFYEYGVRVFSCDSLPELEKIAKYAPYSKVYFRLHANNDKSVINLSEKFGAYPEDVKSLIKKASNMNIEPYGISFHVGSNSQTLNSWSSTLDDVKNIINDIGDIKLDIINVGGGFPCLYEPKDTDSVCVFDIAEQFRKKYKNLGFDHRVIAEPGRALIDDTAILVTSIIGKSKKGDINWLFLDAGVYRGLLQTIHCQEGRKYRTTTFKDGEKTQMFSLAGPTGDGPDV